jgi:hypothetical protein
MYGHARSARKPDAAGEIPACEALTHILHLHSTPQFLADEAGLIARPTWPTSLCVTAAPSGSASSAEEGSGSVAVRQWSAAEASEASSTVAVGPARTVTELLLQAWEAATGRLVHAGFEPSARARVRHQCTRVGGFTDPTSFRGSTDAKKRAAKSAYRGVFPDGNNRTGYRVHLRLPKALAVASRSPTYCFLGRYNTQIEAALVYNAAVELSGAVFKRLNRVPAKHILALLRQGQASCATSRRGTISESPVKGTAAAAQPWSQVAALSTVQRAAVLEAVQLAKAHTPALLGPHGGASDVLVSQGGASDGMHACDATANGAGQPGDASIPSAAVTVGAPSATPPVASTSAPAPNRPVASTTAEAPPVAAATDPTARPLASTGTA